MKQSKFNPALHLKAGEKYERYYTAFGQIPGMRGVDIFLSSKNRRDLDNLVAAARRQEANEEMCIDLRALMIVSLEDSGVVFRDELVAICKTSGKTWFEFELNGEHIKTDWEWNFDLGVRSDLENPFKIRPDLH